MTFPRQARRNNLDAIGRRIGDRRKLCRGRGTVMMVRYTQDPMDTRFLIYWDDDKAEPEWLYRSQFVWR